MLLSLFLLFSLLRLSSLVWLPMVKRIVSPDSSRRKVLSVLYSNGCPVPLTIVRSESLTIIWIEKSPLRETGSCVLLYTTRVESA